jgi:hypothetical protein
VTQPTEALADGDYEDNAVGITYCGEHGWDRFAVCVMRASGDITVLCPVLPTDASMPKRDVVSS